MWSNSTKYQIKTYFSCKLIPKVIYYLRVYIRERLFAQKETIYEKHLFFGEGGKSALYPY